MSLITISGPAGVGKTTLALALSRLPHIQLLPSVTTRLRRKSEISYSTHTHLEVVDYLRQRNLRNIVLHDEFEGNYYGNFRNDIIRAYADDDLWLADFSAKIVKGLIKCKIEPRAAISLNASKTICAERLRERGESESQILMRIRHHDSEQHRCSDIMRTSSNSIEIDASLPKAHVLGIALSFLKHLQQDDRFLENRRLRDPLTSCDSRKRKIFEQRPVND